MVYKGVNSMIADIVVPLKIEPGAQI